MNAYIRTVPGSPVAYVGLKIWMRTYLLWRTYGVSYLVPGPGTRKIVFLLQFTLDVLSIYRVHPPQESWYILVPGSSTSYQHQTPNKVLVCCAFGLRTWDFVVTVARISLFWRWCFFVLAVCCCLHYTSNWYQGTRYQVHTPSITLQAVGTRYV